MKTNIISFLISIDWPSFIQAIAGAVVAVVAVMALRTWKKQLSAQRHLDFIDDLTETVQGYLQAMSLPLTLLRFSKIGIDSYNSVPAPPNLPKMRGDVRFIQESGKDLSEKLMSSLEPIRPLISKINTLLIKGEVLGIRNYNQCVNACKMLIWSFDQVESFSYLIGEQNLNWDNPTVQEILDKTTTVSDQTIIENFEKQNQIFIAFCQSVYKSILS